MGYAKEKEKADKKMRKYKAWALVCIVAFILVLCVVSVFITAQSWKYKLFLPNVGTREEGELRVHFIDVGQGDCTLVELPDDKILLIDGGNDVDTSTLNVMRYLHALKVDKIDYLLVTHADVDHCGGLSTVLKQYPVGTAFLPVADEQEAGAYADFFNALKTSGCSYVYANRSVDLSQGGTYPYVLRFLYPYTLHTQDGATPPANDNEASAVAWLDYQGTSVLFTGDAPMATEEKLMRDDALGLLEPMHVQLSDTEILKVAHHGSADSTSAEFLRYLGVEHAVISCGEDNLYGHPSTAVYSSLLAEGVEVLRTDKDGHVIATLLFSGEYTFEKLGK